MPPPFGADAIFEAVDAGISGIICITEGIPIQDMMKCYRSCASAMAGWSGRNCPGIITPGECKMGIMPADIFAPGSIGMVVAPRHADLRNRGRADQRRHRPVNVRRHRRRPDYRLASSMCCGWFEADPDTKAVVMIGEIGGNDEEQAARVSSRR